MRKLAYVIWGLSTVIAIAWLVEAFAVGRGFVSTYLAPIAFGGAMLAALLFSRSAKDRSGD